jgi:molybdate transport system ATP-binding protein
LIVPYCDPPSHNRLQIRVSADDILVATERPNGISATNILPGVVRRLEAFDGDVMLTVFAGDEFLVRLTAPAVSRLRLQEHTPVYLVIKTRSFRVV